MVAVRFRGRMAALVVALAAGIGGVAWHAVDTRPGYRAEDAMVTVLTGPRRDQPVRLDTRLYLPATATAAQPAPAVLLAHGFGGTKDSVDGQAQDLTDRGYVVLTWTAQGFGRSSGQIHLDSPDYEVNDARALLDWLAARPEVRRDGPGDPRVGVVGGSYGGALALLLAGYDHRVDAIVPQVTWNDLSTALFPESTGRGPAEGVFKRAWAGWLFAAGTDTSPTLTPLSVKEPLTEADGLSAATGTSASPGPVPSAAPSPKVPAAERMDPSCGRFAPDVCRMYQRAVMTGRADPATLRLLKRSSPSQILHRISAPTLLVQGTADTLFPLSEAEANATGIAAAGTRARVTWFAGGHDGGAGSDLDQRRVKAATVGWLDYYVKGTGRAPVRSFAFSRVTGTDYGGTGVRSLGLFAKAYPHLGGDEPAREITLDGQPQPVSNPPAGTPAALSSVPGLGGLGALGALGSSLLARWLTLDIPGQSVVYESAPLSSRVDVTGAPSVRVRAASPTGSAVLFVKLYDVAPSGVVELPGGGVAPVRLTNLPASIDQARPVTVTLPAIVHRFPAGHRLRVTLATADQAYAGPEAPQVYVAGLAGNTVRLPQVAASAAGDPTGPWLAILAGVVTALILGGAAVWLLGRRRSRRRVRHVVAEHADTPLVVCGLGKTYADGLTALQEVDFTVRRGEVVGLLGPNGAGKTTCLRILQGLVRPTAGEVLLFGHPLTAGTPVLSRVGVLVEGPGFLPYLTGRANLELFWQATGRPVADARFEEVLEIAGLGPALDRKVRTYSHGMTQRLAIAQAMLGMPDLLILDEPTDGLDPPQIAELRGVLRRYTEGRRAVLVSSHLLAEVEQTCTHVVVLHRGRRLAAGRVEDIVADSPTVVVDVTDVERAETLLGDLGVRSVARQNGGLVVDLDGVARSELVRTLVAGGVGVDRVAPRRQLEDVFLTLVGHEYRQDR
ncbi:CocE/NonD family hydrolase [Actinopolymorpha alba]|uniref:CocE/NonD family hydrolase n=1 Tax=Actinopolymorpha alba TaxID=533267 RepID=UPI0003AA7BC5|nr:CocE/NonD family hydrolase [Actinopolymorpha alba]